MGFKGNFREWEDLLRVGDWRKSTWHCFIGLILPTREPETTIVRATRTSMNATELKLEVARYRLMLRNKTGKLVTCGQNGPIDMDLIDILVEAISSLERRIDAIDLMPRPKR
jgi:hypothetical protein